MDLRSNVKALARLYDLTNDDRDGMSNLDEHARDLLKNMLDATSQRVLMAHSHSPEMNEGQIEALSLISPTTTPQAKALVNATPERTVVPCLPQYEKKRCKDCRKSYVKPVVFIQESNPVKVAENLNSYTYFQLQHNNLDDYSAIETQKKTPLSNLRGFTGYSSETENDSHYSSCIPKEVEEHNLHTHGENAEQQKVKRIIEKIDSGKWRTKYKNFVPTKIMNRDKNQTSNQSRGNVMFQPCRGSKKSPRGITNGNVDFVKMHPSNGKGMTTVANKSRFSKSRIYSTKLRKSLPRHGSEETTSSVSYSSSYKSSDQSRSYGSDSEDYISGTNSGEYSSQSSEIESPYDTSTSISEEDVYSSPDSDEHRELTPRISSNRDSPYNHRTIPSRSKEVFSRIHKPKNKTSHKKQNGMWKRMKNGLAVVFHHHHHHEHKGKSSISKREVKACEKKAVEKIKKSHGKKKHNDFHGIMEAVLTHVHRSKKNKMKKTVIQRGNNKVVKKSVKGLWKLGARKNKPRLRALRR